MFLAIATICFGALSGSALLLSPEHALATEEVLFVDARSAEDCAAGHIPGARHVDPATLSEERDGVVGLLKPVKEVVGLLAEAGVEPAQHLVVYAGRHDEADLKNATRLFWILEYLGFERVSVLDGGFARWQAEGRAVEAGMPEARVLDAKHWNLQTREERFATRAEVIDMLQHGNGRVMDLRTPEEYAGLEKKPFVAKAGQIPGAYNLPVADLIEPAKDAAGSYCTLKSFEKVEERVSKKEELKSMPVITYCNSGRDASVGYWAYRVAGFDQVSVYDGSMAEWGQKDAMALGAGASAAEAAPAAVEE